MDFPPVSLTVHHISCSQIHHTDETSAEDGILNEVQQSQGGGSLQSGLFELLQVNVKSIGLELLVVEELDCFVVDETVDCSVAG